MVGAAIETRVHTRLEERSVAPPGRRAELASPGQGEEGLTNVEKTKMKRNQFRVKRSLTPEPNIKNCSGRSVFAPHWHTAGSH